MNVMTWNDKQSNRPPLDRLGRCRRTCALPDAREARAPPTVGVKQRLKTTPQ